METEGTIKNNRRWRRQSGRTRAEDVKRRERERENAENQRKREREREREWGGKRRESRELFGKEKNYC